MKFTPSSKYINEILVIIIEHMVNVAVARPCMQADPFQADEGCQGRRFSIGPVDAQLLQTFKWVRNSLRILLWVLMQLRKGSQHGEVNNGEGCPSKLSPRRKMQALDGHNHLHFSRKVIGKDDNPTCLLAGNQEGEAIQKGKWLFSRMQTLA